MIKVVIDAGRAKVVSLMEKRKPSLAVHETSKNEFRAESSQES